MALFFCPSHLQNIGGPGPSPGAASGPSGGPGPPAPCAPLPGLCAGLLRCARPCPPPPGFAPPRRPLPLGFASLAAGPALAVRGFGPRPGPPGRFRAAPLRPSLRWPRPVGAGPRPSLGASLPPAAAPAPPPFPVGLGRRARFASPARVLRLALRPRGLLLSALLCSWRGAAPCAAPALAGPPLPARPCGAASPSLLRAGGPPPPLRGGFLAAPRPPGALGPPPFSLSLKEQIGHCVNSRNTAGAMIEIAPDLLQVSILRHEPHSVHLPHGMCPNILLQAKRPGCPLDIRPDRLTRLVRPWFSARESPHGSGLCPNCLQKGPRKPVAAFFACLALCIPPRPYKAL